jgi:acetyl esterase/lipase
MSMNRRELASAGVATLLLGGLVARPAHSGDSTAARIDASHLVDPELREFIQLAAADFARLTPSVAMLAQMREGGKAYEKPWLSDVPVQDRSIPGQGGQPDVGVYIINAGSGSSRPVILHTHGGGFYSGTARQGVPDLQQLAKALDCVVVTVEYRLAPEATWRHSLEDNYAALLWAWRNAPALGGDPRRIAIMGESAGGGHAALLALAARDRGEVPVLFQALVYPMLDDRTGSTHNVPAHIGTYFWTTAFNRFGWQSFLGQRPGTSAVPSNAVPARVSDLSGLPPTFIAVGALDLFVQEDMAFAERLIEAGVPTELHVFPGAYHGFDVLVPQAKVSQSLTDAKIRALRHAFASMEVR